MTYIAFSKDGLWVVADFSNKRVFIFNSQNKLVRDVGSHSFKFVNGQFQYPCGVVFDRDDCFYITEHRNHRVQKISVKGNYYCSLVVTSSNYQKALQYTATKFMLLILNINTLWCLTLTVNSVPLLVLNT